MVTLAGHWVLPYSDTDIKTSIFLFQLQLHIQSEPQTPVILMLYIHVLFLQHLMSSTKLERNQMSLALLPLPSTTFPKMNPVRQMWHHHQRLHPPTSLWWQWRDAHLSSSWTGRRLTMKPLVLISWIFIAAAQQKTEWNWNSLVTNL